MNQKQLLVPNLLRPRVNTNAACCKVSPFFDADERQNSSEMCSIASKLRLDACPTTKPGCAKDDLQALHAQAPGSAPCSHELSRVHDRLATPKKRFAKPQHSARAVRRCGQQPKAMRATGSATYHSSLEPKRFLHINEDRIDHQPVVIRLAKRLELGQPHIGSHDKQLGMHPNLVSEAAGGRLT